MTDERLDVPGSLATPDGKPAEDGEKPDSSEVVEGPVGWARLKEPGDAETDSADLDALPGFEPPDTADEPGA